MVKVTIETIGEERFIRGFNRIEARMADMRPIFEDIVLDFWKREKTIFSRQGYPNKFAPLSPAYAAWKSKRFPGRKIMQLHQRLMHSLTGEIQEEAQDTVKIIGRKSAEFGTQVPYAHRHQMGTMGMPKREIVQLTDPIKVRWGRMIHEWAYKTIMQEIG